MIDLIQIAAAELGQAEISGEVHNDRIVAYSQESGITGISSDEIPWCSSFVNWVAFKADVVRTNKANARSWLLVGSKVDVHPEPGDVVIFWRESIQSWKGHVGFFLGYSRDQRRVYCLGGNQGNAVSVSAYPADTVLGFRRLQPNQIINLPEEYLRIGAKGNSVKLLQQALNIAGFPCGTADGFFGSLTENAVKNLQAASGYLVVDGEYGNQTRTFLLSILGE